MKKKIENFALCFIGWFFFCSAIATLATAIHRNVTSGFLGMTTEISIYGYMGLSATIWWLLVIKR